MKRLLLVFTLMLILTQVYAEFVPDIEIINKSAPIFPHMFFTDTIINTRRIENSNPYWVNTKEEQHIIDLRTSYQISMLLEYDILAYYGRPNVRNMGILGRHTMEELDELLTDLAIEYERAGGKKVKKAFYLIYGMALGDPPGGIGLLSSGTLTRYIEYGLKNDILVFIDHQIGINDPVESLQRMLPYLRYPNVHLALDPEWRTNRPGQEIGHVTGEELNQAQQFMEEYMIRNNIPGERFLVIHQFRDHMIRNRIQLRTNYNRVRLINCMDGFGDPEMKRETYNYIARYTNLPLKGFKLFYNFNIPGAGYDNPLMTPQEVYALRPRPLVIMYQ